jgi:hypothetical protein
MNLLDENSMNIFLIVADNYQRLISFVRVKLSHNKKNSWQKFYLTAIANTNFLDLIYLFLVSL